MKKLKTISALFTIVVIALTTNLAYSQGCDKIAGADAGPDKTYSTGLCCVPPTIGATSGNCAPGPHGCHPQYQTTYSWTPTTGLSNPNICNPTASPPSTTTYTLTVTYTCGRYGGHGTPYYYCCADGCSGTYCTTSPYCSGTEQRIDMVTVTVNNYDCCRLENPDKLPEINAPNTKVYPNPSPGMFTLELSEVKPGMKVHVYNITGDAVWATKDATDKQPIDLSKESKGVYYLEVKSEEKIVFYKKIVVQ